MLSYVLRTACEEQRRSSAQHSAGNQHLCDQTTCSNHRCASDHRSLHTWEFSLFSPVLLINITIMRHLPERVKSYFVIICTIVMVRTIYLQGAVIDVVMRSV
jgi:hypothetical protein